MHRELFPRTTGDTFDPLSPATVAADVTIGFVLQLDRASRMVAQHAVNAQAPGLEDVIDRLTAATFKQLIESRDAQFGAQIGVPFAEGIVVREPVQRSTLFRLDS